MNPKTEGWAGCLLAGLGATAAPLAWAPRTAVSIDGGFEGQARDLSVLFIDLPLVGILNLLHEVQRPVGILDRAVKLSGRDAQVLTDHAHGRRLGEGTDNDPGACLAFRLDRHGTQLVFTAVLA
jgi:hypothetical protein